MILVVVSVHTEYLWVLYRGGGERGKGVLLNEMLLR